MKLRALAKINLGLDVTGKREDGYHEVRMVMQTIQMYDQLEIKESKEPGIRLTTNLPFLPCNDGNLVYKAAKILMDEFDIRQGVDMNLTKFIPVAAGMAGGSSDAASVLLALNRLWGCGLSRQALQDLGLKLGADVPFFIFGETAFAEGVGEALRSLAVPPAWYVVVAPPVSVPTAEIFSAKELTRNTEILIMQGFAAHKTRNDMQAVVCMKYPEVAESLEWLLRYGDARMSGSGACLFAPFDSEERAKQVAARAPSGWKVWVARGLDRHPLKDWVVG